MSRTYCILIFGNISEIQTIIQIVVQIFEINERKIILSLLLKINQSFGLNMNYILKS